MALIEITKADPEVIPIFIKTKENILEIIPSESDEIDVEDEYKLVYMGKEIESAKSKKITQEDSLKKEEQIPEDENED